MATASPFGEKQARLINIWKSEGFGVEATYKTVAEKYKKEYPKAEQPSEQTIGNARKKAFNLPTIKRVAKAKEPSLEQMAGVLSLVVKSGKRFEDIQEALKAVPVNPFQALDDVAGGRSNLILLLEKLRVAETAVEAATK